MRGSMLFNKKKKKTYTYGICIIFHVTIPFIDIYDVDDFQQCYDKNALKL